MNGFATKNMDIEESIFFSFLLGLQNSEHPGKRNLNKGIGNVI